jgi:hypothetical protein
MRFANGFSFVFGINGSGSSPEYFAIAMMIRLSAAPNATAGTSHNFDGMVVRSPCSNFVEQFSRISQSVGNSHIHGSPSKSIGSRANHFQAAQPAKIQSFQLLSCT